MRGRRPCTGAFPDSRERTPSYRFRPSTLASCATLGVVGNVVNLNKFRKRKAKVERTKQAETNRRLHGRTKLERQRDELQKQQLERGLHGKKLVRSSEDSGDDVE
jgi:hypothetical protein